jgi:outer membrane murein-binding lipoprotein Lpp
MSVWAARLSGAEPGVRSRVGWTVKACVVSVLVSGLLSGCASMAESTRSSDLCTRYDDLVAQADEFRAQDWANVNVDQLRGRVETFQDGLAQLDAVAEGRLDTAVSTLRANLDELSQAVADTGEKTRETAQPLVEQSLDDVTQSWAVLRSKVEAECG